MARVVNMHEAKTNLSKLVEEVMNGTTIYIARNGKPVAQLMPLAEVKAVRPIGLHNKGHESTPAEVAEALAPLWTPLEFEEWLNKPL